jgi:hypothetical protein
LCNLRNTCCNRRANWFWPVWVVKSVSQITFAASAGQKCHFGRSDFAEFVSQWCG